MKKCKFCGNMNPDYSLFCGDCGTKFPANQTYTNNNEEGYENNPFADTNSSNSQNDNSPFPEESTSVNKRVVNPNPSFSKDNNNQNKFKSYTYTSSTNNNNQLLNSNKGNKSNSTLIMLVLAVVGFILLVSMCGARSRSHRSTPPPTTTVDYIEVGSSSEDLLAMTNYNEAVSFLNGVGFNNVNVVGSEDIQYGVAVDEGTIDQISINGQTSFDATDVFPRDADIVIAYHSVASIVADSSQSYIGEDYNSVVTRLRMSGFSNIELIKDPDLIVGILHSEGEVESIVINGETGFGENSEFPSNALVQITYHAYPRDDNEETTFMAANVGNITYVYPSSWNEDIDDVNSVTYLNQDGTIEMLVETAVTSASIEDDYFDSVIDSFCQGVIADGYEISNSTMGSHNARMVEGYYAGENNVYCRVYFADYDEGILTVGFIYTLEQAEIINSLKEELLNSFLFPIREETAYSNNEFRSLTYDVPQNWSVIEQSDNQIGYTSPDEGLQLLILFPEGETSIHDDEFVENAVSQMTWDDLTSEMVEIAGQDAYCIRGINNAGGGYACTLFVTDCDTGIVLINFSYYPDYESIYASQIEHIIQSLSIQGGADQTSTPIPTSMPTSTPIPTPTGTPTPSPTTSPTPTSGPITRYAFQLTNPTYTIYYIIDTEAHTATRFLSYEPQYPSVETFSGDITSEQVACYEGGELMEYLQISSTGHSMTLTEYDGYQYQFYYCSLETAENLLNGVDD